MPGEMPIADDAEPNWLSADEMRAWRAYIDGSQRLMEVLNRELQETSDMSLADYRILVNLVESPNGALRMSDLAADVVSSRSRLTHQVRRMEAAGLVTRRTCDEDGRGVLAEITETGREKLVKAAPNHVAGVRRLLVDDLSAHERNVIAEVFARVNAIIAAEQSQA